MKGSVNGSSSAYSSTRAMRMARYVEEMQLSVPPIECPTRLEITHPGDEAVLRMEDERVQGPLGARAVCGGILGERQLKESVELNALAAAARVLEDHAAGADIAGADEKSVAVGRGREGTVEVQDPQVSIAQIPSTIR